MRVFSAKHHEFVNKRQFDFKAVQDWAHNNCSLELVNFLTSLLICVFAQTTQGD